MKDLYQINKELGILSVKKAVGNLDEPIDRYILDQMSRQEDAGLTSPHKGFIALGNGGFRKRSYIR